MQTLRRAGLLHDFGRTRVPNTIWGKPVPLTELEWARVRLHSYYTDRMLRWPALLAGLGVVAALAHERLDGSGYHRGLSGTAIPALARLLAAADCYHAMRETRPTARRIQPMRRPRSSAPWAGPARWTPPRSRQCWPAPATGPAGPRRGRPG